MYYKVMAICEFAVLPGTDETQSGALARIIAPNKPYITAAPMKGPAAQTLESSGGLPFTTCRMPRGKVIQLAWGLELRFELGIRARFDLALEKGTAPRPS